MKTNFKNRRTFTELAERMGLYDTTDITGQIAPITNASRLELVNNQRRFIRGMLKLPMAEQTARIAQLREIIAKQEAEDAAKENS
jgi:uncharacterized small protein (DUF1192 family)